MKNPSQFDQRFQQYLNEFEVETKGDMVQFLRIKFTNESKHKNKNI